MAVPISLFTDREIHGQLSPFLSHTLPTTSQLIKLIKSFLTLLLHKTLMETKISFDALSLIFRRGNQNSKQAYNNI